MSTNKAQSLASRVGATMDASMGMNRPRPPAAPIAPGNSGKLQGRTRGNSGEMLLENIAPDPDQPRREFDEDELALLARSLKDHGQLQPVRVRWSDAHGKWVIVAGERRYRAALRAGFKSIACVFVEAEQPAAEVLRDQLVENALRADLKPVEQANAFRRLMDMTGWTGKELADQLHLNPSTVTKALAILELPLEVQEHVAAGTLAPTVAYEVSKLAGADTQREVAEQVVAGGLTRQEAVRVVKQKREQGHGRKAQTRTQTLTFRTKGKVVVSLTLPRKTVDTNSMVREALAEILDEIDRKGKAA